MCKLIIFHSLPKIFQSVRHSVKKSLKTICQKFIRPKFVMLDVHEFIYEANTKIMPFLVLYLFKLKSASLPF